MIVPLAAPVTPDAPTAQSWLLVELSKPQYRASQPTWFDQLVTNIRNWFESLTVGGPGGVNLGPLIIVTMVVVVLGIAFLVFGLPRLNRRSGAGGALFGEDDSRTAAQILAAAGTAAAAGDFALASVEGFRSIARSLAERTLLTTFPGTTAHEFSIRAGRLFPDLADNLTDAARIFDGVRYLGAPGSQEDWTTIETLATVLATSRPPAELIDA